MLPYGKDEATHQTAPQIRGSESQAGIDLFDDEFSDDNGPQTSIYTRYEDGTRFPARTVTKQSGHFETVLQAWAARGVVHDYRTKTHGEGVSGTDMRAANPS